MLQLDETAYLEYKPRWLDQETIESLNQELQQFARQQERIKLYGKWYEQPRLTTWVGIGWTAESGYHQQSQAHPWTPVLTAIRDTLNADLHMSFNSVLINEYRDGNDSVGWHADDERNLNTSVIASLSLGGERTFKIRAKQEHTRSHQLPLGNGDLLIMYNAQSAWEHCVPKTKKPVPTRLNLTFRQYI